MTQLSDTRPAHSVATQLPRRVLFAPLLVAIGPASIAALRFVLPYKTTGDGNDVARAVLAHPGRESAVIWLGVLAMLTMPPTVYWMGRHARQFAPRLGTAALCLLVPGYLALNGPLFSDVLTYSAQAAGQDQASIAHLYNHLHPAAIAAGGIFVLGHVVGTILLGCALLKSPLPRWIPIATIACQPTHFVAAVVLGSNILDLIAWGTNAVVFAAAATFFVKAARS